MIKELLGKAQKVWLLKYLLTIHEKQFCDFICIISILAIRTSAKSWPVQLLTTVIAILLDVHNIKNRHLIFKEHLTPWPLGQSV